MPEKIIVTMTTWKKRISNIPAVLDTIYAQTLLPDKVIINLAFDEVIPNDIQDYINSHDIEIFRVPDTKVYKKLIPTLRRYPDDCVIAIDDDWLYPAGMIEDFMNIHKQYPDNPISGNHAVNYDLQCHCGCASLVKANFFGSYLDCIDSELITNCPSDDIVYTYFANKAGFPYVRTNSLYYTNMVSYNDHESYSSFVVGEKGVDDTFTYLVNRFGTLLNPFSYYFKDRIITDLIYDIHLLSLSKSHNQGKKEGQQIVYNTSSYKVGQLFIRPIVFINSLIKNLCKFEVH